LRTRYLAMVCIVSVMLGVATLIVVNSVMGGFSTKLRQRLHGLLSDVVVESYDYNGFSDPQGKMALIRSDPFLNERIEAMAAALEIFAMIQFSYNEWPVARPVRLIGIDPEARARIGGFSEYLIVHKEHPTFKLDPSARKRWQDRNRLREIIEREPIQPQPLPGEKPPPEPPPSKAFVPEGIII